MQKLVLAAMLVIATGSASAQTPAHDPSATLGSALPADVAQRVLARIADARARQLPAQALEHRALELVAKGASADRVEQCVNRHANAMQVAKNALVQARGRASSDDEVAAGAEIVARGVDGQTVAELARIAPADRPIAVPLYVLGALMERGLPMQTAIDRVSAGLANRATDAELEAQVQGLPLAMANHGPAARGPGAGTGLRPAFAGPPAAIPANPGAGATPPVSPPVKGRPPLL